MVREALDAVITLYTAWAESDPTMKPVAANWRKALEEFDARQARQENLPSIKT
jgi:hypothetical protein